MRFKDNGTRRGAMAPGARQKAGWSPELSWKGIDYNSFRVRRETILGCGIRV